MINELDTMGEIIKEYGSIEAYNEEQRRFAVYEIEEAGRAHWQMSLSSANLTSGQATGRMDAKRTSRASKGGFRFGLRTFGTKA